MLQPLGYIQQFIIKYAIACFSQSLIKHIQSFKQIFEIIIREIKLILIINVDDQVFCEWMTLVNHDFLFSLQDLIQSQILQSNVDEWMSVGVFHTKFDLLFCSLFSKHQDLCKRTRLASVHQHYFAEFGTSNEILSAKDEIMINNMYAIRKLLEHLSYYKK